MQFSANHNNEGATIAVKKTASCMDYACFRTMPSCISPSSYQNTKIEINSICIHRLCFFFFFVPFQFHRAVDIQCMNERMNILYEIRTQFVAGLVAMPPSPMKINEINLCVLCVSCVNDEMIYNFICGRCQLK